MSKTLPSLLLMSLVLTSMGCGPLRGPDGATLPTWHEKPATGLEIQCSVPDRTLRVGDPLFVSCTITNTTNETRPLSWGAQNFSLSANADYPVTAGTLLEAWPEVHTPIMIQSLFWRRLYALYLPAGESLGFSLRLEKLRQPGDFTRRIRYDPLPKSDNMLRPVENSLEFYEEHYLTSEALEYTVSPAGEE